MAHKFATLVIVIIVVLLTFFAFQNFYKPSTASNEDNSLQSASVKPLEFSFSSANTIPHTDASFVHNSSLANGTRAEIFSLNNEDSTVKSLLVLIPKELVNSSVQLQASQPFGVVKEDPVVVFSLSGGRQEIGIVVNGRMDVSPTFSAPEYRRLSRTILALPIPPTFSESHVSRIADLLRRYEENGLFGYNPEEEELYEPLNPEILGPAIPYEMQRINAPNERTRAIERELTNIMWNDPRIRDDENYLAIGGFERILSAMDSYLLEAFDNLHNPTRLESLPIVQLQQQEAQEQTTINRIMTVSEFSPITEASFEIMPDLQGDLLVRSYYSGLPMEIYGSIVNARPDERQRSAVKVRIDLSNEVLLVGGQLPDNARARIVVQDSARLSQPPREIEIQIQVNHVSDGIRITPGVFLKHASGENGELVFLINALPIRVNEIYGCGIDRRNAIELPRASAYRSTSATVIFVPGDKLEGCVFMQKGEPLPMEPLTRQSGREEPSGLSRLYSVVNNVGSWKTCSQAFCACQATNAGLTDAVNLVNEHMTRFYDPYSGHLVLRDTFFDGKPRFCESFIFNFANLNDDCPAFERFPRFAQPNPGTIQLVDICVEPLRRDGTTEVVSPRPDPVISARGDTDSLVLESSRSGSSQAPDLRSRLSGQWLCHDPVNVVSSQPNHECSREQRETR